jgi:DNA-directed RNA polymerase specialized sigma24 family protein
MSTKHAALQVRATEASEVIRRLLEHMPLTEIAERARVSKRSVYRWLHEGRAPHPLILEGLRRIESELE